MNNQKTTREMIKEFLSGKYYAKDTGTQCDAGWYDWFCKDTHLAGKTEKLYNKLLQIIPTYKFDIDKTYVFFKNNCPMNGSLYDDFRICDLKTREVIYTITPASGHTSLKGLAYIWGKENEFEKPLLQGKWQDIIKYFREI